MKPHGSVLPNLDVVDPVSALVSGSLDFLAFPFDHLSLLPWLVLLTRSQYISEQSILRS